MWVLLLLPGVAGALYVRHMQTQWRREFPRPQQLARLYAEAWQPPVAGFHHLVLWEPMAECYHSNADLPIHLDDPLFLEKMKALNPEMTVERISPSWEPSPLEPGKLYVNVEGGKDSNGKLVAIEYWSTQDSAWQVSHEFQFNGFWWSRR